MSFPRRPLGPTGLEIGTLALGTMMFGSWGNPDETECHRMVHTALDAGIDLFDTADMYDQGVSEEILGRALGARRSEVVVATKVGNPMSDDPSERGLSARWIRTECEASLRRLGTDHIDLYQLHRPDPTTPVAETVAVLDELVRSGKVRAVGTSTFSAEQLEEFHAVAGAGSAVTLATEQPPYSVFVRSIENEVLPTCRRFGLGVLVWAPLNGGWLTGKYRPDAPAPDTRAARSPEHFDHRDDAMRQRKHDLVEALVVIADEAGLTLTQLALGFVLADPTITCALIGPRTPEQLDDLLAAGHVALGADVLAAIDELVPPGTDVNPANAQ